jgi:dienelactone hydrolase
MVTTREIAYEVDGREMIGQIAVPDGDGPRPAVLISHEGPGLDLHARELSVRLAELGYVAFALDYIGGGQEITDRDEMMQRLGALFTDPDLVRRLARAGLDVLLTEPTADASRVAAIGYCAGGMVSMELARSGADVKAIVGFHAGLGSVRPEDSRNITGKVLMCIGADDPLVPPEQRVAFEEEMRAANVDWRMNLYGGAQHSFTHTRSDAVGLPGVKYDRSTDERSWRAMLDLFDEVF